VIGAGPAGIAAATVAAESGQRVVLIDECPAPGGQILAALRQGSREGAARTWVTRLERSTATVRTGTAVIDIRRLGDANFQLHTVRQGGGSMLRATRVVLATGARASCSSPSPGGRCPA
jgi:predicted flavoprotein YhiN